MDIQTCLHLLDLEAPLTPVRVHRAYRRAVKRWHPDQFAHQPAIHALAEERLKAINQAYTVLKDYIKDQPAAQLNAEDSQDPARRNSPPTPRPTGQSSSSRPQPLVQGVQTVNTNRRAQAPSGFTPSGSRQRSTPAKPSSSFERILGEIGQTHIPPPNHRSPGARPLSRPHSGRRRGKGLRVEGFRPLSPLQPVRPVSKISPIEGSD